jgi:hypothetical protein
MVLQGHIRPLMERAQWVPVRLTVSNQSCRPVLLMLNNASKTSSVPCSFAV